MQNPIVLAFSGGLDTSFCVPWLRERGHDVVTVFADAGGVTTDQRRAIEDRALELGATDHRTIDVSSDVWRDIVVPLVQGDQLYQNQYPLLCSDRYVIVQKALEVCDEIGTDKFAHGCTGMGNDQVRFDLTVRMLGDYEIVAPIREIQREVDQVREHERDYLESLGFEAPGKSGRYTINENLLGTTVSGSEIDEWETPGEATYCTTAPPGDWPDEPLELEIGLEDGKAVCLDGESMAGPDLLETLNDKLGAYGIGRGIYTGDTTIGLKGRIVFEAPGITGLMTAHRALEEAVSTRAQNRFKPTVAQKWVELVYEGFFHEPLKTDLEAYLASSQRRVTGSVTLQAVGGRVEAVAVDSPNILQRDDATYAQSADWGPTKAEGFIQLFGQSSSLYSQADKTTGGDDE